MNAFSTLSNILRDNRFTAENLPGFEEKLFFEGDRRRAYLTRFVVLLSLSTIIASGGILADSTATVIGAMIVAPLMTPIVATTAALVMGRGKRAAQSILTVLAGIIIVIFISWLAGIISVLAISFETNSQIVARINPSSIDLIVALAAGAAGAFALSRTDVADSLPGVAIAIALVPPLCVVGISLSQGQGEAALGASLLFLTNLLSILLAGGAVFAILRPGPAAIEEQDLSKEGKRRAYVLIFIAVFLVAVPLFYTTINVGREGMLQRQIITTTEQWLSESESGHVLDKVQVKGSNVDIILHGSGEPTAVDELGEELETLYPEMETAKLSVRLSRDYPLAIEEEAEE